MSIDVGGRGVEWIVAVGTTYPKFPDRCFQFKYITAAQSLEGAITAVASRLAATPATDVLTFHAEIAPADPSRPPLRLGVVSAYSEREHPI